MDTESLGLLAIFLPHAVGGVFLGWRLLPRSAREELRGWFREDDGGTPGPEPGRPPSGGGASSEPPLPSAAPSGVRLREPGRLGERLPGQPRRPRHPAAPERVREPQA
jgi:hypothetical protein